MELTSKLFNRTDDNNRQLDPQIPPAQAARIMRVSCAGVLAGALLGCQAAAQSPHIGRIVGNIDGISHDGEQYFVSGWVCQQGRKESIQVHVYGSPSARDSTQPFVTANRANFDNEPAVGRACQDAEGGKHRFLIALPFGFGADSRLFVHGIRVVDGVPNDAVKGSGLPLRRLDRPEMQFPTPTVPSIPGSYHALDGHPRVFVTAADIRDLVSRINAPASYSAKRFRQLANQVANDLAARTDWDATYSGCFVGPYLYAFSYEPQDGHDADTRAALGLGPDVTAPKGGAVVAARLALYAALAKAGAIAPAGSSSPEGAAALAKRILLAWADHGFPRDEQGRFRSLSGLSCDKSGKTAQYTGWALPLQLGRGVVYSVHAQDLLQSFGALDASEETRLDALHSALFDLIRQGYNQGLGSPEPACQRYTNGFANGLAALFAIARLLDDPRRFDAVLSGGDARDPVVLPWLRFFDGAIYGESDHPMMDCSTNTGPDALTSTPAFTTAIVAPGEVQDRYRNAGVLQTFGYPMFTLERLINAAEILRNAGYDPYAYRGNHQQSIEMALQYYACYGKTPGFYATVTLENARACPNYAQYEGKVVNGVDQNVLFGTSQFATNRAIMALEDAAKETAASGAFALDAIFFGRWRD